MATAKLPTKVIAGVTVVDTPLVQEAVKYAHAHSDEMTYNHVMRSWLFGVLASQKLNAKGALPTLDLEAQALSTILHDLGWDSTGELISSDKRFEVDGAIAACSWLKKQQEDGKVTDSWDEHRVQLLWDAIALHSTPSIAAYKEPVVAMCTMGIAADFQGPKTDPTGTLTSAEFDAVNAEFPHRNLAEGIRKIICGFCRTKPATTYDNWQMEYGKRLVDGYKTEGSLVFDLIENSVP